MIKIEKSSIIDKGEVKANPTKDFFVRMLTRDIELMDAIMDLIDNCIDGVHRSNRNKKPGKYLYKGFFAEITLTDKLFIIKDNCGGIPLDVAKNYAFRLGRSEDYHDDDQLETLGMYGIGMKRAIFKIGLEADVITWNENSHFAVRIPKNWANEPNWSFEYSLLKKSGLKGHLNEPGTSVNISNLHANISNQFKDKAGFLRDLSLSIKSHYGYIIQQGFRITLNGVKIDSIELNILTTKHVADKNRPSIKPYVYFEKKDDVEIEVIVGFYRPFASEAEIEKELSGDYAASKSENAGVTVLCNDRVVLHRDKTFLTGWGEFPVPKYHTQFIPIAGVVHFRSNKPINLPVTTTKRGLDTSSPVYAMTKNRVKEGLKLFTTFTNYWKTPSEQRVALFKNMDSINALVPGQSKSALVELKAKRNDSGKYQLPKLPKPILLVEAKLASISFKKEIPKVEKLSALLFDGDPNKYNEVGSLCFDKIYNQSF